MLGGIGTGLYEFSGYAIVLIGILAILIGMAEYSDAEDELEDLESDQEKSNRSPSEEEQDQYRDALRRSGESTAQCIMGFFLIFGGIYMTFRKKGRSDVVFLKPPPPYINATVPPGMMVCPYCQAVMKMGLASCPNCKRSF